MADQKSCLIVGCGDIGSRLAKLMLHENFAVWGVRRNPKRLPEGVTGIAADISNEQLFSNWPHCDYVVYAVAASERTDQGYYSAYVKGLANLIAWLEKTKQSVQRLLFVSSTRVYHQQQDEWVNEESETLPTGFAGERLLEAEKLLDNTSIPSSIIRFAGIYGPGREYLLKQIRAGYGVVKSNDPYTNRVHQDDCAGILAHLIDKDLQGIPLAKCYNGVDNQPVKLSEVVNWLVHQLDIEPSLPLTRASGSSKRCSNQRLLELGYEFKYPDFKTGYQEIIAKID